MLCVCVCLSSMQWVGSVPSANSTHQMLDDIDLWQMKRVIDIIGVDECFSFSQPACVCVSLSNCTHVLICNESVSRVQVRFFVSLAVVACPSASTTPLHHSKTPTLNIKTIHLSKLFKLIRLIHFFCIPYTANAITINKYGISEKGIVSVAKFVFIY